MIEILNFLDDNDYKESTVAKERIKKKFELLDYQADIAYKVWKERYMVAKVKVDYSTPGRRFFYGKKGNTKVCGNSCS